MYNWFHTIAVVVQVLSALGVILLVLLQHGKGADMGAAFGSGASGSLFGATGSANFLSRSTGVLAGLFLASTLALAFLSNDRPRATESLMQGTVPASPAADIPATRPPQAPSDVPSVSPAAPVSGGGAGPARGSSVPSVPSAGGGSTGAASGASTTSGAGSASVPSLPSNTGSNPATNAAPSGGGSERNPK
jgi:preprotein translocase subunit SecG